jgi:hypothetical protein
MKLTLLSFYIFLIIYAFVIIIICYQYYLFKLKKAFQNSNIDADDENRFYVTDIFQVKNGTLVQKLPKVLIIGEAKCGTGRINTIFYK